MAVLGESDSFPAFYTPESGYRAPCRLESPLEAARKGGPTQVLSVLNPKSFPAVCGFIMKHYVLLEIDLKFKGDGWHGIRMDLNWLLLDKARPVKMHLMDNC